MRLGYFTMPLHPPSRAWVDTLREDREAIVLADSLGFHDAFVGEHLTDVYENVTSSFMFLASLIHETQTIRLATGTSNLTHTHPVLVAAHAAMFDHMSDGRLILGVSPGALPSDAEILGILDEDRSEIFAEAIEVILELWQGEPPYDITSSSGRYQVSTRRTGNAELGLGAVARPLQQPRPEIVGTVVAPFSKGAVEMGKRDFHPLSANFLQTKWLASHWSKYAEGKEASSQDADTEDWRIARTIFVADDESTAVDYGKLSPRSPYRHYYSQMLAKFTYGGRLGLFKKERDEPDDAVTLDGVLDDLVICGTPQSVVEQLLELRERTGDFGEIVYAGMDWVDPALAMRSMELMAQDVIPAFSAAVRESAPAGMA